MSLRTCWAVLGMTLAGATHAATLIVNNTSDAGDGVCDTICTLRDAVDAAQTDDRILFDLALPAPIVIGLTGAPLQIDVPLRIVATDGVRTTLRRVGGGGRLMEVVAGGDARVIGLSFENGNVAPGTAGTSAEGGAISVATASALELRDCVFRGNVAQGAGGAIGAAGPGGSARGGAIHAAGDLLVENCAFVGNQAIGGSGGFSVIANGGAGGAASGGAIYASGAISISNTTFSQNTAIGGQGGSAGMQTTPGLPGFAGGDGAAANGGAIVFADSSSATVAFSTLISNQVTGGAGAAGGPGGPFMPGFPPPPPGPNGANGITAGAAIAAAAAALLNASVVAANVGAVACDGGLLLTARTSNRVDDASCPGVVVVALETQFEPIDTQSNSPHFKPLFGSLVVDTAIDCLDAVAFEPVDLDQLLTPRPLAGNGVTAACDFGAIELNPVLFGDGFEEPPPAP